MDLLRRAPMTLSLAVLALLALLAALKLAQSVAAPVTLGFVVGVVFAPMATRMGRIGAPPAVSATVALALAGLVLTVLISAAGPVVTELLEQVPKIEAELRRWMEEVARVVRGVDTIGREIEETLAEGGEEAVKAAVPGLIDALWLAPNFAAQSLIFAGTLFFFLLTRDGLYDGLSALEPALRSADRAVSHYFIVVTLINAGLGAAVFAAMTLIGLPNPLLWGGAAFVLNFVLYLGPLMMMLALLVAGLAHFGGALSLLPPVAFLGLNLIEAQFVSPALIGHRLQINPLTVFLGIVFGLWFWGPIGGIVALPLLVWGTVFWSECREKPFP